MKISLSIVQEISIVIFFASVLLLVCQKAVKNLEKMLPDVNLGGQWSIDIMQNGDDFWIIDMGLAVDSALVNCVPKNKLKPKVENWIPQLPGYENKE